MKDNEPDFIQAGFALFTRILMKYDALEKEPIEIEGGKLYASHIHMIEAIGKDYGKTITALSAYFMITKGAVSQVVTRLYKDGYLLKTKKKGNDKEIILELTKKGWKAFETHEKINAIVRSSLKQLRHKYSADEAAAFVNILNDIDLWFGQLSANAKKK